MPRRFYRPKPFEKGSPAGTDEDGNGRRQKGQRSGGERVQVQRGGPEREDDHPGKSYSQAPLLTKHGSQTNGRDHHEYRRQRPRYSKTGAR